MHGELRHPYPQGSWKYTRRGSGAQSLSGREESRGSGSGKLAGSNLSAFGFAMRDGDGAC